jgi:hypothetical protein
VEPGLERLGRPVGEPQLDPVTGRRQQLLEHSRLVTHPEVELPHDLSHDPL